MQINSAYKIIELSKHSESFKVQLKIFEYSDQSFMRYKLIGKYSIKNYSIYKIYLII